MKNVLVDIVLASYNGEKYISEQLDSILNQSHKNIQLYISDDGSSDTTVNIINEYVRKDSRVHLINMERVGGVIKNFETALEYTTANYIMLSDQDDFWEYNKIEKQLNAMLTEERKAGNVAVLGYTDLALVDDKLQPISGSFYRAAGLNRNVICTIATFRGWDLSWDVP